MMRFLSRSLAAPALVLALLGLCLGAGTATAEVPYDMSYRGRLTDAVGAPLAGPVVLDLRIYDVLSGGSSLYGEHHAGVALDNDGAFTVFLGGGVPYSGIFGPSLFSGVNRYLEVAVDSEVLSPRLPLGSVPWALVAEEARDVATFSLTDPTSGIGAAMLQETSDRVTGDSALQGVLDLNTSSTFAGDAALQSNLDEEAAARAAADAALQTAANAAAAGHTEDVAALQAAVAVLQNFAHRPPSLRFEACSDGLTVADAATGLLWERKTMTGGLNDVSSTFSWSSTGNAADGTAYTVFLAGLNTAPGFAGHTDWRLPLISELQSIMVGPAVTRHASFIEAFTPDPNVGTNPTMNPTALIAIPAIHPEFAAIGGPTAAGPYWSAVSVNDPEAVVDPNIAYAAYAPGFGPHLNPAWGVAGDCGIFGPFGAPVCPFLKLELYDIAARAVRTGSCAP